MTNINVNELITLIRKKICNKSYDLLQLIVSRELIYQLRGSEGLLVSISTSF